MSPWRERKINPAVRYQDYLAEAELYLVGEGVWGVGMALSTDHNSRVYYSRI